MKSFDLSFKSILMLTVAAFVFGSCGDFKKSSVVTPPSLGSVDFTRFVSLGNSLTAGYQSGALYESAQKYSFPAQIARQAGVADSAFQQPLISEPGIGGRMKILNLNGPVIGTDPPDAGTPLNTLLSRPYNNLGVPGAVLFDLTDTASFAGKAMPPRSNPFFQIVLRSSGFGSSPVAQASALHPTFMTVWIGANDVLGYATSGGTVGTMGPGSGPTDVPTFSYLYNQTMSAVLSGASGAKIAVANIPDVTGIPFFTTIPDSFPNPQTGKAIGPFIVERHHADGTLHAEPINARTDYILLTAIDSLNAKVGVPAPYGTGRPLPDEYVLDSSEVATVETAIDGYNAAIANFASNNSAKVVLVDAHTALQNFAKYGFVGQGVVLNASYISGGFFGLDGVHPTSQGYAYVANIFIGAINQHFGSNISLVPISSVPSSIVLGKRTAQEIMWPEIHYSDLRQMLGLIQQNGSR